MGFVVEMFFFVYFLFLCGSEKFEIICVKFVKTKHKQTKIDKQTKKRVFQYHYNLLSKGWLNILFQTDYL